MKREKTPEIELSAELLGKIQDRMKTTQFNSVEDYVEVILNEVVDATSEKSSDPATDLAEDNEVQDRLQSLGYLE
jgi:hypothetical protein